MAGLGGLLTAVGTGLGGFMHGYDTSRADALKRQLAQQEIEQEKRKRQAQAAGWTALQGALGAPGLEGLGGPPQTPAGGGGLPGGPSLTQQSPASAGPGLGGL